MTRDRSIYLSAKNYWLLLRIVKATNAKLSEAEVPATIESAIETIIDQWAQKNCPKLFELWDKREAINAEAEKLI